MTPKDSASVAINGFVISSVRFDCYELMRLGAPIRNTCAAGDEFPLWVKTSAYLRGTTRLPFGEAVAIHTAYEARIDYEERKIRKRLRDLVLEAGRIRTRACVGLRFAPSAPSLINITDSHKHRRIKSEARPLRFGRPARL